MLKQRGDTIIEVLIATTVFSMVAIGSLSIMGQGTAMAQRALEIDLVRQQMDAQADALRYMNYAYAADFGKNGEASQRWDAIVEANAVTSATPFSDTVQEGVCALPIPAQRPFAVNVERLTASTNPVVVLKPDAGTYSQVRYDLPIPASEGLWVQAVRSPEAPGQTGYYDFHIRACWHSPGDVQPVTLGTIVRLYEPRS